MLLTQIIFNQNEHLHHHLFSFIQVCKHHELIFTFYFALLIQLLLLKGHLFFDSVLRMGSLMP